jgi:integrase
LPALHRVSRPRRRDRHLPPCVYQQHGAYWLVRAGKWTRLGTTLTTALEEYARLHEAPQGGMVPLIERVLAKVGQKLAPSTRAQYRIAARRLQKILAEFAPEQVKPRHVAQIKASMVATPNMANRVLSFLRTVMAEAVEEQLIDSNPCIGIRRLEEAKRRRHLTDGEIAAIHAAAGAQLKVIIELLLGAGQRVVDTLTIRRSQLRPEGIEFEQQKTGARLIVAWNPDLRLAVEHANALHGNVRALTLLHNRFGKAPDYRSVSTQWQAACRRARVEDAQLRDLRAKSLTLTKKQGKDAQALGGHESPKMTERYLRERDIPVVDGPSFRQVFDSQPKSA